LVTRPITADFDELGRLYVADSSGSNEPVHEQLRKKPHRILRLEDSDGDGIFDKSIVFADRMMFPEGTMWYGGSLYVAAPPSIWKLTDNDGDGVADERIEWFQGKTLTGCANDLHGPYLGPDGWIYWCKGAFAQQTYERPGKRPFVTRAAHIFRSRPDASGIEPVMTGGMDNPVDVVFTPGGERIFSTTFFQHPGGGLRDGLIHAIYGGVYGKDHDPIYEHKWTGPYLLPVLVHHGPAASCGLTRYESTVFGPEYQDNLFVCLFNMHKVVRHVLVPSGATFQTRDFDFLTSDSLDFHPTDVLEDADGSLLVLDTGGWYKLCCPTSQLDKPDVLGAIYRIRRKGAPAVPDPRGSKHNWQRLSEEDLTQLLGDSRPAVRRRAVEALAGRGAEALAALEAVFWPSQRPPVARLHAVWAATRIEHPRARALVRRALSDPEETVRQAAAHSVSVWRDPEAVPQLVSLLRQGSAHNRRVAAEALGRIGNRTAVPALFEAIASNKDRILEHSLIFALIEIGDPPSTAQGLASDHIRVRRAALIALDQMDGGRVEAKEVLAELASSDPSVREAAWWIASRHPEWGSQLAGYFREQLRMPLNESERNDLARRLARFASNSAIQELLAESLKDASLPPETQRLLLQTLQQAHFPEFPESLLAALVQRVQDPAEARLQEILSTLRTLSIPKAKAKALVAELLRLASEDQRPPAIRLMSLAAIPGGLEQVEPNLFAWLCHTLGSSQQGLERSLALEVLTRCKLSSEQLLALLPLLGQASPPELDRLLDAYAASSDDQVGLRLIAALEEAPGRSGLRVDTLRPRLARFGPRIQERAEQLYARLDADAARQKAHLEQLLPQLGNGDVRRGQAVFNSAKAACSKCHAIGYLGGTIGPDLTRIGQIRSERDLLEAIIYPSASMVRSYEPVLIATVEGRVINGLVRKETSEEIVLAINANEEVRVRRQDIEAIRPSKVSVMPSGLEQQLSLQELADLIAFLKACK
jgi:putative membrane-bound dehydrogenase-like protein